MTLVKSLRETYPDLGLASGPVDVQVYFDGRGHVVEDAAEVELAGDELAEVTPLPVHGRH